MRVQPATVGLHSAATAPVTDSVSAEAARAHRAATGGVGERLHRAIGRVVLGLPPSTWLLIDVTLLAVGVYVAFWVFPPPPLLDTPHVALWQAAAVFALAVIIADMVFGLYERETFMSRSRTLTRMVLTTITAGVIAYAIIYVIMYSTVGRRTAALAMALFFAGGVGVRLAAWWVVRKVHCGLLVVGPRALYESFAEAQAEGLLHEYRLIGYATTDSSAPPAGNDAFHVGPIRATIDRFETLGVTDLVVGDGAARDPRVMEWIIPCLQRRCRVTSEAIFYEKATGQILVDEITPSWFLLADLKVHCDQHASLKRLTDLVIAGTGLFLSAPIWLLIAAAVKLCDGGPVFHVQKRVGQNGRIFKLFKFRTMRTDAENGKSVWCLPDDPRITSVGRFLRRSRLDELPQLWNVLLGRMSVVGPRPERPDIVGELCGHVPYYAERHLVKPGITGWAQISFRYGASVEDAKRKLQFDLYYLKHMSLELDMIILLRTAGTFLRGGC